MSSSGSLVEVQLARVLDQRGPVERRPPARGEDAAEALAGVGGSTWSVSHSAAAAAPGARALQADLAEVQVGGGEVGVGRVVPVEARRPPGRRRGPRRTRRAAARACAGRRRPSRSAAIARNGRASTSRPSVAEQREEAAVRGVDMQPDAVALAQRQRLVDRVDRAEPGGAGGERRRCRLRRRQQVASSASRSIRPPRRPGRRARPCRAPGTCARACSGSPR